MDRTLSKLFLFATTMVFASSFNITQTQATLLDIVWTGHVSNLNSTETDYVPLIADSSYVSWSVRVNDINDDIIRRGEYWGGALLKENNYNVTFEGIYTFDSNLSADTAFGMLQPSVVGSFSVYQLNVATSLLQTSLHYENHMGDQVDYSSCFATDSTPPTHRFSGPHSQMEVYMPSMTISAVNPVPEPTTLPLFCLGLIGIVVSPVTKYYRHVIGIPRIFFWQI